MKRTYAAVPHEYYDEMAELTDEEFGRLIRALLWYSMEGEEVDLPGNERYFWRRVVNREQGLQQHYEELAAVRSEAGKKGALARWGNGKMANDSKYGYVKDKDKDKDKDKVNSSPILGGSAGLCMMTHAEQLRQLEREGIIGGKEFGVL